MKARKLYSYIKFRSNIEKKPIEEIISPLGEDSNTSKAVEAEKSEENFTLDFSRYTMPDFPFWKSLISKSMVKLIKRGYY